MAAYLRPRPPRLPPASFWPLAGAITLSLNDLAIKFIADTGYALHQAILIRALVGMAHRADRHGPVASAAFAT